MKTKPLIEDVDMTEDELKTYIKDHYEEFMAEGFDLNSSVSLHELFYELFQAGWYACLDAAEGEE